MCEWKPDFDTLNKRVDAIETRMSQVEHDVSRMRSETQEGIRSLNTSVDNLGHDFGQRFNNIETTVVAEKAKWGETLRKILVWTAKVVLAGCAVAMGVSAWKTIFGGAA